MLMWNQNLVQGGIFSNQLSYQNFLAFVNSKSLQTCPFRLIEMGVSSLPEIFQMEGLAQEVSNLYCAVLCLVPFLYACQMLLLSILAYLMCSLHPRTRQRRVCKCVMFLLYYTILLLSCSRQQN